jgi:2-polyprenyl-3-methyl-5-hydroxy-6-metoxy-1,4-benzoquinol methylase
MAADRHASEHYAAQYRNFDSEVAAIVRREAYVDDIGQTSWLTTQEQDTFLAWLGLTPEARLLDVGCGAGGPTLRIARETGCSVVGFDIDRDAIDRANSAAEIPGSNARFFVAAGESDALGSQEPFDAVVCVDAVNHLADRLAVLRSWWRCLRPGGWLLFTDPVVVIGPVSSKRV